MSMVAGVWGRRVRFIAVAACSAVDAIKKHSVELPATVFRRCRHGIVGFKTAGISHARVRAGG